MDKGTSKKRAATPGPLSRRIASQWRTKGNPIRVLVASHSHPLLSKGGAEIAAYALYTALRSTRKYAAFFLGCMRGPIDQKPGVTFSQPFSDSEYLYAANIFDWFKFSNADMRFPSEFRALLAMLQPKIVHFHHYANFGVEAFLHVREALPDSKIILTLHEYLAICHHFGQMVTKQSRALCYQASPTACSRCFADIPPSDFFLRKLYIDRFFNVIDHFVAPSAFLAERYVAWGIPESQISVIENVVAAPLHDKGVTPVGNGHDILRVGYFGQISMLKGINIFLEAAQVLEQRQVHDVVFEIYGDHSGQPPEFQADFLSRIEKAARNVKFHGPYDQQRVDRLMQSVDIVATPSIWWENSPVVIQEAFRNKRPVICSDIGGMAEKVRDGVDGFHFPVGNAIALASLILQIATKPQKLDAVRATMRSVASKDSVTDRYARLYDSLLGAP